MIDGGLGQKFREHLPQMHWQRIETGGTGRGIPDSNFCFQGCEGWVEFKWTAANAVDLSPEQVGWILRRKRAGGRVFVAVRRLHQGGPRKGHAVDMLYLFDGADAKELKSFGLQKPLPLYVGSGGPARWDWERVRRVLIYSGSRGP